MTTHPFSKKRSQLRKLLYAAAAVILLGSLLASYMHWEANHLEFNENTAPAGCVPGLSGLRILVLSDIHTNLPLLEKAATIAEQARPDMIVFLGDLYTDFLRVTHAGDYITQMKRLSSVAPAYACLGNHDMALADNVERVLKEGASHCSGIPPPSSPSPGWETWNSNWWGWETCGRVTFSRTGA